MPALVLVGYWMLFTGVTFLALQYLPCKYVNGSKHQQLRKQKSCPVAMAKEHLFLAVACSTHVAKSWWLSARHATNSAALTEIFCAACGIRFML